jgi:hemolysin III
MAKRISVKLDEIVNTITHGIGILLSITALVLMVVRSAIYGTAASVVGASIFGAGLIILYSASTIYHSARKIRLKYYLNKFDHAAIYVLIASSYTPITLVTMRGAWGWSIFGVIWAIAIFGILFKIFWYKPKYRTISAWGYVAMGLVVIVAVKPLIASMPLWGLIWMAIGGVAYIIGVLFYLSERIPFGHGIFHLFVIAGSFAHFWAIYHYVLANNVLVGVAKESAKSILSFL